MSTKSTGALAKFDHVAHARKLAKRPGSHWRFQTGGSLEVHADLGPLTPAGAVVTSAEIRDHVASNEGLIQALREALK